MSYPKPTVEDLAMLICLRSESENPLTWQHTMWLIESCEEAAAMHNELRRMADDAGIPQTYMDWQGEAVMAHRDFRRLLARDDWEDPAEVIDASGDRGVSFDQLLSICRVRREQGEGDQAQLEAIQRKLERCAAAERERRIEAERAMAALESQIAKWLGSIRSRQELHELASAVSLVARRLNALGYAAERTKGGAEPRSAS